MNDVETRLQRALEAEAPAARDPMFRVAVLLRRERSALRARLLRVVALTLCVAILAGFGAGAIIGKVAPGPERLALIAVIGMLASTALAAPYFAAAAASRWRAGARSTLRAMQSLRPWG